MMEGILRRAGGQVLDLPPFLSWRIEYTAGSPCDSFEAECPWEGVGREELEEAVEFTALWRGKQVFRGVVDEVRIHEGPFGRRMALAGRGMAALLLDNQAEGAEYGRATIEDILRDHVRPYGIETGQIAGLPAVEGFAVSRGSSEWQVLYQFARYHGNVMPRFDRQGRLVLAPWDDREVLVVDQTAPVTGMEYRMRRYGVLSEVLVQDRGRLEAERVENRSFLAQGGRRRQVLTMPERSNYLAMRYRGDFQIRRSQARQVEVELTAAEPFYAWPGELVRLERPELDCEGVYRVLEAEVWTDGTGQGTRLTLARPDAVL